jgi:heat shock protein HtpX
MTTTTTVNDRRALVLGALFAGSLLVVGGLVALLVGPVALMVAAVLVAVGLIAALTSGERIALRAARAEPASPDLWPRYHNLVQGLSLDAAVPVPKLYVIKADAPNALAVGLSPGRAAIAVTTGLLDKLNLVELEGVLAHELSLIASHGARVRTLAVVLGGLPGLLWQGRSAAGRLLAVLTVPLAPLLRHVGSASAELEADERGAHLTRYPPGLIHALARVADDPATLGTWALAVDHLWLVEPAADAQSAGPPWLRAAPGHEPVADRIAALREL